MVHPPQKMKEKTPRSKIFELTNKDRALEFLQENKLIASSKKCVCDKDMPIIQNPDCLDGYIWSCLDCNTTVSIRSVQRQNIRLSIMKLIAFLVCFLCSMLLYHHTEASSYDLDIKQTLSIIKVLLKSGLSNLHLSITSLFEPTSGQIPIDGTPLIMNYFAHDCDIHVGRKRMIFTDLLSCKADVTEAVTHVSRSCEKTSQTEAVQCAIKMILEKIQSDIENTSTPSY